VKKRATIKRKRETSVVYLVLSVIALVGLVTSVSVFQFANGQKHKTEQVYLEASTINALAKNADLSITKTVDDPNPCQSYDFNYTITATNLEDHGAAKKVKVQDQLPAGVDFVSYVASRGTYDVISGLWKVPSIHGGHSETLTITANPSGTGVITNTATYLGSKKNDPNPTNDVDTTDITVDLTCAPPTPPAPPAPDVIDLSLMGQSSKTKVKVGDSPTFTFKLKNKSNKKASGVKVKGKFSKALAIKNYTASKGSYDTATGNWDIAEITGYEENELKITLEVSDTSASTSIVSDITITAADQTDTDQSNNSAVLTLSADPVDENKLEIPQQSAQPTPEVAAPQTVSQIELPQTTEPEPTESVAQVVKPKLEPTRTPEVPSDPEPNVIPQTETAKPDCTNCNYLAASLVLAASVVSAMVIVFMLISFSSTRKTKKG